jgi:tRNA (guanine-N7-)-methyltransferase
MHAAARIAGVKDPPERRALRTYGRTKARTLKPRQAALLKTLLPRMAIDVPASGTIDLASFGACGAVALEIGFGGGEHLVAQARAKPGTLFLGAEPFLNGVASCLRHIEESGVANVRLFAGDARVLAAGLPAASLDCVYVLFPDPWPKTRHWKRRLIQPDVVAMLARALKPGGEVRFATDWRHYAAWTLDLFLRDGRFEWMAGRAADWRTPWPDHVATRYEAKRLGDSAPIYLRFQRR